MTNQHNWEPYSAMPEDIQGNGQFPSYNQPGYHYEPGYGYVQHDNAYQGDGLYSPGYGFTNPPSNKTRVMSLLLALVGFLGVAGLHRFYAGKWVTGLFWLFTGGLLGVGTVVDILLILFGKFKDSRGDYIVS